jgi:hypothetical protein
VLQVKRIENLVRRILKTENLFCYLRQKLSE